MLLMTFLNCARGSTCVSPPGLRRDRITADKSSARSLHTVLRISQSSSPREQSIQPTKRQDDFSGMKLL